MSAKDRFIAPWAASTARNCPRSSPASRINRSMPSRRLCLPYSRAWVTAAREGEAGRGGRTGRTGLGNTGAGEPGAGSLGVSGAGAEPARWK